MITFEDLIVQYFFAHGYRRRSSRTARKITELYYAWIASRGYGPSDVAKLLFDVASAECDLWENPVGKARAIGTSGRSLRMALSLNKIKAHYDKQTVVIEPDAGKNFGVFFNKVMKVRGWSKFALARKVGISPVSIFRWTRGHSIRRSAVGKIQLIEQALNLNPGTLIDHKGLAYLSGQANVDATAKKRGITRHGRKIAIRRRQKCLRNIQGLSCLPLSAWPITCRTQIMHLCRFGNWSGIKGVDSSAFKALTDVEPCMKNINSSLGTYINRLGRYFSYINRQYPEVHERSHPLLPFLADGCMLISFFEEERALNDAQVYGAFVRSLLTMVKSLLKPEKGWLTEQFDYGNLPITSRLIARALPESASAVEAMIKWSQYCENSHRMLVDFERKMNAMARKVNGSLRPLPNDDFKTIFPDYEFGAFYRNCLDDLKNRAESNPTAHKRYALFRDRAMLAMCILTSMRLSNIVGMLLDKNLILGGDTITICIPGSQLKNGAYLPAAQGGIYLTKECVSGNDYDLAYIIHDYVANIRPKISGLICESCASMRLLFPSTIKSGKRLVEGAEINKSLSAKYISTRFSLHTYRILRGRGAMGLHAMRHINAGITIKWGLDSDGQSINLNRVSGGAPHYSAHWGALSNRRVFFANKEIIDNTSACKDLQELKLMMRKRG